MNATHILILAALFFIVALLLFFLGLSKDNRTIKNLKSELIDAKAEIKRLNEETYEVHASYITRYGDKEKYKTEASMVSAIRTKLAMMIANTIITTEGNPEEVVLHDGNKQYWYDVKVLKK